MLELAMDRCKAHELLEDHEYSGRLTMEGFRRLLIRAGYSAGVVRKAALERGFDRLSAGEVM